MADARYLKMLDDLVSAGKLTFKTNEVERILDVSPQAASNLLTRLVTAGLVDRVKRGHYAMRPIGALGTHAASEDIALAVGAAFSDRRHRIAYRSALDHHGLLQHPVREITVATDLRTTLPNLSGWPLRLVLEKPERVTIGALDAAHGARVSSIERALLECAARPELAGGIEVVATALADADVDTAALKDLAHTLNLRAALHRLGSLADALQIDDVASHLEPLAAWGRMVDLDPRAEHDGEDAWRHRKWGVAWPFSLKELQATVRN
jgi:predicted transcriptional regulator of viral defense system